ncbi:MAG TPA: sensor histidine kinase [Chitinophagaceae bacterium]|nr:sensor histidine kinase [Chitinophagaceae bacterium]
MSSLQSQNLQLQNEKLKIQYDFLKAQINPHFLYNTLSFFYSKTAATDKQTAEGIALLTDIMRYSLQQGKADGKVELEDEVAHLNSYIRLQQMRFNNTLNIRFSIEAEPENYRILPHIFITLVENAFKHGEVNNPMHPLEISLAERNDSLVFTVSNKIRKGPVDSNSTGVGLNNVRSRIKMEYGEAALLENNTTKDFFTVSFSVQLALLKKKTEIQAPENESRSDLLIAKKIVL